MPDNGQSGLGSSIIRFNGSSGTVSGVPDKKRSRDENEPNDKNKKDNNEQEGAKSEYVDRSAQLRATLNSLALLNVANIKKTKPKSSNVNNKDKEDSVE